MLHLEVSTDPCGFFSDKKKITLKIGTACYMDGKGKLFGARTSFVRYCLFCFVQGPLPPVWTFDCHARQFLDKINTNFVRWTGVSRTNKKKENMKKN